MPTVPSSNPDRPGPFAASDADLPREIGIPQVCTNVPKVIEETSHVQSPSLQELSLPTDMGGTASSVRTPHSTPPLTRSDHANSTAMPKVRDDLASRELAKTTGQGQVKFPPIPRRPFAAGDGDIGTKPVYRPSDDPLPFSRNARLAALDAMILVFAARLHIEHLNGIGKCQEDVADLIRRDLDAIHRLLDPEPPVSAPASPDRHEPPMPSPIPIPATKPRQPLGDVRPRLRLASTADEPTPSLFGPTRPNVGQTGALPGAGARVAPPYGD